MKKTKTYLLYRLTLLVVIVMSLVIPVLLPVSVFSQVPNCAKFSVGINADGKSIVTANEMVNNDPGMPIYLTIRAENFKTIYEGEITDINAPIELELCPYITHSIIFEIKNETGYCSDTLQVSSPPIPQMTGRKVKVLCSDPLVKPGTLVGDTFPQFQYPCGTVPQLEVNEDFQEVNECGNHSEAVLQTIYREIEGYDDWGQRFSAMDTIVVYKYPEFTAHHIDLDTLYHLYCGKNESFGPQILYNNPASGRVDTLSLLKALPVGNRHMEFKVSKFAELCNLSIDVTSSVINNTKCEKRYQIEMELVQDCFFADGTKPLKTIPVKGLTRIDRGRYRLAFTVLDVDTLAPEITLDKRIMSSFTGSQGCEAPLVIPQIKIEEKCSGIRQVLASAPGYFTVNLKKSRNGKWVPDETIYLPKDGLNYREQDTLIENAFKVYIVASDSCDLVSRDSFYIQVDDNTDPTVSLLKNIRVGLTGQLTWIDVSIMNEDSYDNCGVAMVLGRRTDWATAGNVNLCDGLETDNRINPVEAYYATFLRDLMEDSLGCGSWLYEEWMKDSVKYCTGNLPGDIVAQVGGGWTTQIPFTCEDACKDIEVELLVIDNWCNWNTTRSTVKVKDKQPISIVQDLKSSVTMNCSSYNNYYADVVNRAVLLNDKPDHDNNRVAAFAALDSVMGGYVQVWEDLDGQLTANEGQNIIPSEHNIWIRKDICENYTKRQSVEVFDENAGKVVTRMENVPAIRVIPDNEKIDNGIVAVNCSSSTYEKIFINIDECGTGTIRRRFYVAGGCGETGQGDWLTRNENRIEYTREQVIYIQPDCALSAGMVDMPPAVSAIDVCEIEKNPNGNYIGELHPDFTGWPKYTWSQECRNLTVGYKDKLFRLVGNNPAGQWKLVRNWHISDKCVESEEGSVLHFEQILILNELDQCDSTVNEFLISGRVVDPEGAPIQNVTMKLQTDVDAQIPAMTSIQGTYSMTAPKDNAYKVIPYKNDEMLKGISTFDLVMIQKDILNIKKLDNVYRRIAADVNNNGLVEATDVIELRKAILRPDFKFANNTSYQFREAGSMANFTNIESLDKNWSADFVGIKIGDVNFSASNAVPTSRSSGMKMVIQDQWLRRDMTHRIPVRIDNAMDVLGFQFEWDLKEQDITSISLESGRIDISTEEYAVLDDGKLTVSWFDIDERHLSEDQVLFYINIKTNRRTTLQNLIKPSATILNTESYVEPGIVQGLHFTFQEMHRSVSQINNRPNPFKNRTVIQFEQEFEGPVYIGVFDMTGKAILQYHTAGYKGVNEITISGTRLPGPGMYYYRITSGDQQWTNKMIYIR